MGLAETKDDNKFNEDESSVVVNTSHSPVIRSSVFWLDSPFPLKITVSERMLMFGRLLEPE